MINSKAELDVPQSPPVIPGFENINRYWDKKLKVHAAKLMPGELYVSMHGEMVVTVLGSCVAACIRDKVKGIGGMNHFMLPQETENSQNFAGTAHDVETRYGNWAMESLINEVLKRGGRRGYLEVKLFGGGKVMENMSDVGERNIDFVRRFLVEEGLKIVAEDLGGLRPRKILYFSDTGACRVRRLNQVVNNTVFSREKEYAKKVAGPATDGSIELF
ncbi:MAG: chemoreceptor glutamine deamidase CheD [Pseudomonadales bacterium]|nr:chemoreceptor glutamine deamidase CheD [Pseudomonadales bacterium]